MSRELYVDTVRSEKIEQSRKNKSKIIKEDDIAKGSEEESCSKELWNLPKDEDRRKRMGMCYVFSDLYEAHTEPLMSFASYNHE